MAAPSNPYRFAQRLGEGKSAVTYRFDLTGKPGMTGKPGAGDGAQGADQEVPEVAAHVDRVMDGLFPEGGMPDSVSVKVFKDDPGNYIDFDRALATELEHYRVLRELGVRIPLLYGYDEDAYLLVKEYVAGDSAGDLVAQDRVDEDLWLQIIALAERLRRGGKNIDFFPANFLVSGRDLVYVDYEIHDYQEEWSFHEWGIFYWLNARGFAEFLRTGDGNAINKPGTYKPYDGPELRARRDALLRRGY